MSRTVRGSFGQDDHHEESSQSQTTTSGRGSSGRKSRKNVERKPTFLSFFKVNQKRPSKRRDKLISMISTHSPQPQ